MTFARLRRGARQGGIAILAVALVLVVAAPASADEPFFGVSLNHVFNEGADPNRWDLLLDAVQAAGIRQGRTDAQWSWVERERPFDLDVPLWDWTRTDAMLRAMLEHEIRWLPVLTGPPAWERVERRQLHSPPASMEHYARFAAAFAGRYGRGGSFWSEAAAAHLPYAPVTVYEIWNEPNLSNFWYPRPQPERYAEMYVRARDAIHALDPDAVVMLGGLTTPFDGFLPAMYASRPELAGAVDAVGIHPYSRTGRGAVAWVRKLRETIDGLGSPGVPIYVTELGWPTRGKYSGRTLPDEDRAFAMELAANTLARGNCGVRGVVAYSWITPGRDAASDEDWYGIYSQGQGLNATGEAYSATVATRPEARAGSVAVCGPMSSSPAIADVDTDRDGLSDGQEAAEGTSMLDLDTDDDGLGDAYEVRRSRTHPALADSDRDRLPDGLEGGRTRAIADPPGALRGTSTRRFRPDLDPATRTLALRPDSDRDGRADGREDRNGNGRRDRGETDPRRYDRPRRAGRR